MLATGFGVGLLPFAPGSFGSLLGLLLAWSFEPLSLAGRAAAMLAFSGLGILICERAARKYGKADPGCVVFDEIAAMPLVFAWVPLDRGSVAVAGFLLFRLFDIWKPWPIRRFERLPGGVGIMADDIIAGIYAGGALAVWTNVVA